jgi:hypothetical protein
MKSMAWRSARLEAAKPTNIFFSSKLIEPRTNQQGKQEVPVNNICSKYSFIDALAP